VNAAAVCSMHCARAGNLRCGERYVPQMFPASSSSEISFCFSLSSFQDTRHRYQIDYSQLFIFFFSFGREIFLIAAFFAIEARAFIDYRSARHAAFVVHAVARACVQVSRDARCGGVPVKADGAQSACARCECRVKRADAARRKKQQIFFSSLAPATACPRRSSRRSFATMPPEQRFDSAVMQNMSEPRFMSATHARRTSTRDPSTRYDVDVMLLLPQRCLPRQSCLSRARESRSRDLRAHHLRTTI